jgi:DNA-damage-inducible protein J
MATTTMEPVSTKLRPEEKKLFIETCESIGTSPSNAIRMFVSAFNKRGGFPFDPSNPMGFNAQTLAAIDDAAAGRVTGPFSNVDDMLAFLDED